MIDGTGRCIESVGSGVTESSVIDGIVGKTVSVGVGATEISVIVGIVAEKVSGDGSANVVCVEKAPGIEDARVDDCTLEALDGMLLDPGGPGSAA